MEIKDTDNCPVCGSPEKRSGSSLHIWEIEYECGCTIWGALDKKTHGDNIEVTKNCPNEKK